MTRIIHASAGRERPRTPPRIVPTERQVQRAILDMMGIAFRDVFVTHVPNGAHLAGGQLERFKQMGALKGDGLKNGFPDLSCYWEPVLPLQPGMIGHALMEVKRPGYCPSDVSEDQRQVHSDLIAMKVPLAIVTSPLEAFNFLKSCGAPSTIQAWDRAA